MRETVDSLGWQLDLRLLLAACERWRFAHNEWPHRLETVRTEAIKATRVPEVRERATQVLAFLDACLLDLHKAAYLPLTTLASRFEELSALEAVERQQPDWDQEGSLYSSLHQVRNLSLALDPAPVQDHTQRLCTALALQEQEAQVIRHLNCLRQGLLAWNADEVRQEMEALRLLIATREPPPLLSFVAEGTDPEQAYTHWHVVAVEDMPEWNMAIRNVLAVLRRQLGAGFQVELTECASAAAARHLLEETIRKAGKTGIRPLLVLDLGIPAQEGGQASHQAGRELLTYARCRLNVPTVILTAPHRFLQDHLQAHHMGVADYLLKGYDPDRRLLTALWNLITVTREYAIRITADTRTVSINGVDVVLDPMVFAVASAIAGRYHRKHFLPVTVEQIKETLVTRDGIVCKDIEDAVYKARTAFEEAFRAVGQIVDGKELLVSDNLGERFAYRLVGRMIGEEIPGQGSEIACRILVIDDEVSAWQRPVAELLTGYGYNVATARTRAEAVTFAALFEPDLLCLDLCFPSAPGMPLDPSAGLSVFRELSARKPGLRAVVLTSFAEDDMIRAQASDYKIRPDDFITKRPDWEAVAVEIVLKLWRFELERQRQAHLPLPDLPHLPYLHIRYDSATDGPNRSISVSVFGRPWRPTINEAKLLWLLAQRPGCSVSKDTLYMALWSEAEEEMDVTNALKKLVHRLRERIGREWFAIQDPIRSREVAQAVLANDGKHSYMLNARIQITQG